MNYVCGFMCSWDIQNFLLIRKTHPEWQKGKLNGIGGKIEKKEQVIVQNPDDSNPDAGYWLIETPFEAMVREFHEETGIITTRKRWHCFHIEEFTTGPDGQENTRVYFFAAFGDESKRTYIGNNNDPMFEIVSSYNLLDLFFIDPEDSIYNVPYLLRMIIDNVRNGTFNQLNPQGVNSIP